MLTGAGRGVVVFRWLDAIEEAVAAASREAARAGKGHDRTLTSLDLRTAYRLKKWLDAEFRCFRSGSDIADDLAVSLTAAKGSLHRLRAAGLLEAIDLPRKHAAGRPAQSYAIPQSIVRGDATGLGVSATQVAKTRSGVSAAQVAKTRSGVSATQVAKTRSGVSATQVDQTGAENPVVKSSYVARVLASQLDPILWDDPWEGPPLHGGPHSWDGPSFEMGSEKGETEPLGASLFPPSVATEKDSAEVLRASPPSASKEEEYASPSAAAAAAIVVAAIERADPGSIVEALRKMPTVSFRRAHWAGCREDLETDLEDQGLPPESVAAGVAAFLENVRSRAPSLMPKEDWEAAYGCPF